MSNRKRSLRFRSFVASFGLVLTWFVVVHAQELQLGNVTYARAAAPTLRMPVTSSARFFRGVGGVAFSAVAVGTPSLYVHSLQYDAAAPDGQRLVVGVGPRGGPTQKVRGKIYDWQLVPVARYALDENGSAVTLFGRLDDEKEEGAALATGQRVINYHPRLDNTLVGLRLLQADVLIIQPNAADLFKRDGKLLLGAGESGHNYERNLARFQQISTWQKLMADKGQQYRYQSYVVGDLNQRVTFAVSGEILTFTGEPFWNAWQSKPPSATNPKMEALVARHDKLVDEYNANIRLLKASGENKQALKIMAALTTRKTEIESVESQIEALNEVVQMPEFSNALSQRIRELDGINPVVYGTLRTVMHYRALFKHFQQQNQPGFSAFVTSLDAVPIRPAVTTPTLQGTL
jgi:hypothetical protein